MAFPEYVTLAPSTSRSLQATSVTAYPMVSPLTSVDSVGKFTTSVSEALPVSFSTVVRDLLVVGGVQLGMDCEIFPELFQNCGLYSEDAMS